MLKITLNEGFAFDLFAINCIKQAFNPNDINYKNCEGLLVEIIDQLKLEKVEEILKSEEFSNLTNANRKVFVRIDEIKQRSATGEDATYIDQENYNRWLAKKALQEKFFPDEQLNEQKIGYK